QARTLATASTKSSAGPSTAPGPLEKLLRRAADSVVDTGPERRAYGASSWRASARHPSGS
ncbi:MAG: hypothetical protein RXO30_00995, partial [Thermoproteus sp.]